MKIHRNQLRRVHEIGYGSWVPSLGLLEFRNTTRHQLCDVSLNLLDALCMAIAVRRGLRKNSVWRPP